jgi:hypothetical protein
LRRSDAAAMAARGKVRLRVEFGGDRGGELDAGK